MAMMRIGKVTGKEGPPGPGYANALILEEDVAQIQAVLPDIMAKANSAVPKNKIGANNGVASLDDTGKVPASQLPSYVDDVIECNNFASFPPEGEADKIYVAKNTNKTYRWSGTSYVVIGGDIALGETSSTAYAGDKGKANADDIIILKSDIDDIVTAHENFADEVAQNLSNKGQDILEIEALATLAKDTADAAIPIIQKGANNGVASLDDVGKVPASQLPSYVDDVIEYDNFASFPPEGETGKIYVAKDTNKTYRWSGTSYTIIRGDIALGETSSTAYAGDKGKANADNISAISNQLQALANSFATDYAAINDSKINKTEKGAVNGVASLDNTGKVPASQLPSYVDDVIECEDFTSFPSEGESGKIYVAKDTNKTYRWSGTAYTIIAGDITLGETFSTAYAGDKGKANADNISLIVDDLNKINSSIETIHETVTSLGTEKVDKTIIGISGGIAELDQDGKIPAARIPITQLGTTIGCFGFEVNAEGDLLMYYPDNLEPAPHAWIDELGQLKIDLNPAMA